ncbi:MAG: hypothetical protein O2840_04795, partial [bacterium]|nr:hypothetical protein [bacterium]
MVPNEIVALVQKDPKRKDLVVAAATDIQRDITKLQLSVDFDQQRAVASALGDFPETNAIYQQAFAVGAQIEKGNTDQDKLSGLEKQIEARIGAINDSLSGIDFANLTGATQQIAEELLLEELGLLIILQTEFVDKHKRVAVLGSTVDVRTQEKVDRQIQSIRSSLERVVNNPSATILDEEHRYLDDTFNPILAEINKLRAEADVVSGQQAIDIRETADKLEIEYSIVVYKTALMWLEATIASYEMNNRGMGRFYEKKETFLNSLGYYKINDVIISLRQKGEHDLANRMQAKLEIFKKNMTVRTLLYTTYDALKVPAFGVGAASRSWPNEDVGVFNTNGFVHHTFHSDFDPTIDPELMYTGEKRTNAPVIDSIFKMKISGALQPGEQEFNGATILERDGEWATLQSTLTERQIVGMMVNEMF